jgi:hypothetical protein
MTNNYSISTHGDWLEREAAEFIRCNIPAYENIWRIFIGHQGNGVMAGMNAITRDDEEKRKNFAQHHYTILESLYFMQRIVDDISDTQPIHNFETYRKLLNQIMAYQAYSGRLRDNIKECFTLMAHKDETDEALNRLNEFYHQRHVFIHGRKVPFALDHDLLFKLANIKKDKDSPTGFDSNMPWESMVGEDMVYLEEAITSSINALKPIVNNLLSNLYNYVRNFIQARELSLSLPLWPQYEDSNLSGGSLFDQSPIMPSSGSNIEGFFGRE